MTVADADPPESFDPAHAEPDPVARFARWWAQARAASPYADAMALATASRDGAPSVRMVLLRGLERGGGFAFFTNLESAKAWDLQGNPRAALAFHWPELHRQIRVTGPVGRLAVAESDAYWQGRPQDHRLGAWASPQSRVIADRAELERAMVQASERFGDDVPLPPFWGGYRVVAESVEFWQGRESRLHDRVRYTRSDLGWLIERLAP